MHRVFAFLILSLPALAAESGPTQVDRRVMKVPVLQYDSPGISIPAATAEEPRVKQFGKESLLAALKFLDDGAHAWVREKSCVACHTSGVYLAERPVITAWAGVPSEELREDFISFIPAAGAQKDRGAIQSVWRTLGLASWDHFVTKQLSEPTRKSMEWTLSLLTPEGSFATIQTVEIPYITTDYELTAQAARALALAPGYLKDLPAGVQKEQVQHLMDYLRKHEPVNDYERAVQLQLAPLLPELYPQSTVQTAQQALWSHQQSDGGWSTRSMSPIMLWHKTMNEDNAAMLRNEPDAAAPGSDAYMTAFAIHLLRDSGTPASDPRIQRGLTWLKENQRVSGRWWMKSLYKTTYHYSTYISTAVALRALASCGELEILKQ